jgi:hypothetical protein
LDVAPVDVELQQELGSIATRNQHR